MMKQMNERVMIQRLLLLDDGLLWWIAGMDLDGWNDC